MELSCSDNPESVWQTITDTVGNYKIDFPDCELDKRVEIIIVDDNDIPHNYCILNLQEQSSNSLGYSTVYYKLHIDTHEVDNYLHVQGYANSEGTNAVIEHERKLSNWLYSREFIYILPNDLVLRQRWVYNNSIVYSWGVITTKEQRFNKSVTKFLDSFELHA